MALERILIDGEFRWWEKNYYKILFKWKLRSFKIKVEFQNVIWIIQKLFSPKYSLFFNSGSWKVHCFSPWRTRTHTHMFTRQFVSVKLPQDQQITQRFLSFRYSCASEVVLCGEQKHLFVALKLSYTSVCCIDLLRYMYLCPCMCVYVTKHDFLSLSPFTQKTNSMILLDYY